MYLTMRRIESIINYISNFPRAATAPTNGWDSYDRFSEVLQVIQDGKEIVLQKIKTMKRKDVREEYFQIVHPKLSALYEFDKNVSCRAGECMYEMCIPFDEIDNCYKHMGCIHCFNICLIYLVEAFDVIFAITDKDAVTDKDIIPAIMDIMRIEWDL
jgi:hypothetical protein